MIMQLLLPRVEAGLRRWLRIGAALATSLVPAALMPEGSAAALLLNWIESISLERVGGIAALSNAFALML